MSQKGEGVPNDYGLTCLSRKHKFMMIFHYED